MKISELGEFGLINRIRAGIKTDASVIKGIGDDCAVVKFSRRQYLLLTSDMLVEGVDFTSRDDPALVGRKALAVSLSDIAACAGAPRYALVSLGLPKHAPVGLVDKIYSGMRRLARQYRVNLVGGDISRAKSLTLDVALFGTVERKRLVLRSGAKKGDFIFVTGSLGGSISGKHLRFVPRLKEAEYLARNFNPGAMIDVSDGLSQDLGHILEESRVGALIYARLIPRSRCAKSLDDALYSGEDFELLFTLPAKAAGRLLKKKLKNFTAIGRIVDKKFSLRMVDYDWKIKSIQPKGYQHF